jgi:hypothetical protein
MGKATNLVLGEKIISNKDITKDILYDLVRVYIEKNQKCPRVEDFSNKNNLPCWETVSRILNNNKITINDFFLYFGREDKSRSQIKFYNEYVNKFKNVFNNIGYIGTNDLLKNNYGLPTANWLIKYCPDKSVKTYDQFLVWCGFKPFYNIPKNIAIDIIYKMQSKLDSPICAKDFKNPKEGEIGIRTVINIWGEVWKMQKELGLTITGKHADKYSIDELKVKIINLCNKIYQDENRNIITYNDIKNKSSVAINILQRYFKQYTNMALRDFINSLGFILPKEGNGMNFKFNDGEKVLSQYEFYFSNYLRNNLHLEYNKDYFRDIKYKTFSNCNKKINCDFVINYKGKTIYIEIIGMLKSEKKLSYRNDIYKSKSKEKYRKTLIEKEDLFIKEGLEYYFLFTEDLNNNYLNDIFI